jgi:hypothetical protein
MDQIDLIMWALRLFLIGYAAFSIPRSILPIKKGWKNEDFKNLNKGVCYLLTGVMCLIIFILIFPRITGV